MFRYLAGVCQHGEDKGKCSQRKQLRCNRGEVTIMFTSALDVYIVTELILCACSLLCHQDTQEVPGPPSEWETRYRMSSSSNLDIF